jgi:hypothetical protein
MLPLTLASLVKYSPSEIGGMVKKRFLSILVVASLLGCAQAPAIHGYIEHVDAADKTILIPLGSNDLMGRVTDLFRDECWTVKVTEDGSETDTTVNQTRYRLEVGATSEPLILGYPFALIGYDYNLLLIDTESGEEILNLHGYGSSRRVIARIKRALEGVENGTCPGQKE